MVTRILDLRPGEGRTLALLGGHLFLLLAALTVLATAAEAIFLSALPYEWIPWTWLGGAAVTVAVSLGYESLERRTRPAGRSKLVLGGSAVVLLALRLLLEVAPVVGPFVLLIAAPAFGVIVGLESASLVTRALDTRQARRLYPAISGLGGIGATAGAFLLATLATQVGAEGVLWLAIPLLVLPVALATRVRGKSTRRARTTPAPWKAVVTNPFPLLLVAIVLLTGVISTTIKFQFSAAVKETLAPDEIAIFLGWLYGVLNVVSIVFGIVVTRRIVSRLGAGLSLATLPALMAIFGAAGLIVPGLVLASGAIFTERLFRQNLQRPLLNIVTMPLAPRLAARTAIAVRGAVESPAVALTSIALLLLAPHVPWQSLSVAVLAAALLAALCSLAARRFYVRELVAALHARRLETSGDEEVPWEMALATRRLLHEELRSETRDRVALALQLLTGHATDATVDLVRAGWPSWPPWLRARAVSMLASGPADSALRFVQELDPDEVPEVLAARVAAADVPIDESELQRCMESDDPTLASAAALRLSAASPGGAVPAVVEGWRTHDDPKWRHAGAAVLAAWTPADDPSLSELAREAPDAVLQAAAERSLPLAAPLCVEALADDDRLPLARSALLRMGVGAHPDLLRAARDPERSAQALLVLVDLGTPEARRDVLDLLEEEDPALRTRALRALLRRPSEGIAGEDAALEAALEREVERSRIQHESSRDSDAVLARAARSLCDASLERVFMLLGLLDPARPYRRIQLSLASSEASERSFAVEALDEMLPPPWRERLLPILDSAPHAHPPVAGTPKDPHLARLAAALAEPDAHPSLALALRWQAHPPFDGLDVFDLDALARSVAAHDGQPGPVLHFGPDGPENLGAAVLGEPTRTAAPGPLDVPMQALWSTLALRPDAARAWMRGLARALAPLAPDQPDVSLSGASLASRTSADDVDVADDIEVWQRVFYLRLVPFFMDLSPARLRAVAGICRLLPAGRGEVIVREGRPAHHAYVVCRGLVEVRAGSKVVSTLSAGEAFGVNALLSGSARSVSVTAPRGGELLAIDRVDFQDLLASHVGLVQSFSRLLATRARMQAAGVAGHAPRPTG